MYVEGLDGHTSGKNISDRSQDHSDGTLDGIDVDLHPTAAKLVERSKAFLTEVQHLSVILQMTLALRTLKV